MLKFIPAALAAIWSGAAIAQSCTVVPVSPDTGLGEVTGFVLAEAPLCYFLDRPNQAGHAELTAENACFIPEGLADCTRAYSFTAGAQGFRFLVYQDRLRAGHEKFSLRLSLY